MRSILRRVKGKRSSGVINDSEVSVPVSLLLGDETKTPSGSLTRFDVAALTLDSSSDKESIVRGDEDKEEGAVGAVGMLSCPQ